MLAGLLPLALACGCSRGAEPRALAPTSASPPPAASAAPAASASPGDACREACARFGACVPEDTRAESECVTDCRVSLLPLDGAARRYGDCLAGLSCARIRESLSMNMGVTGACYVDARRGR